MIDVEIDIINFITQKVRERFTDTYVTGEHVKSPPHFPAICIMEMMNTTNVRTMTSESVENFADVMFQVDGYSNKVSGKKHECREMMKFVDELFLSIGFQRIMFKPIPNFDDATVFRITARYSAVVSRDKTIYRR